MDKKPNLLFISGYFPPANFSSGCVRTWNLAYFLTRLGWHVSVVTPHPSLWNPLFVENATGVAEKMALEGIHPIYTGLRWRFLSGRYQTPNIGLAWLVGGFLRRIARYLDVDTWSGWVPEVKKACAHLQPSDVDVILASGSPFISFSLAEWLSNRLGRPYVLDYRDLWTGNPLLPARRSYANRLEHRVVSRSAVVTAVSPTSGSILARQNNAGAKVQVITNGYDAQEMASVQPYRFDHFAIVYTGGIFPPFRVLSPLMNALKQLDTNLAGFRRPWKLHYFGLDDIWVRKEAEQYGLLDQVVCHGKVTHKEALEAVRGANLAVIVTFLSTQCTLEEAGHIPGKIFEAIGLGTPILAISPPGSDVEEIVHTAGLGRCFVSTDTSGMVSYIADVMIGRIPPAKNPENYAWASLAEKFNLLLRKAIHSSDQGLTGSTNAKTG
jgi:glycosyltransferase involved in cell wall biosynthesis